MYPLSFRETPDRGPGQGPESSVAARIAEEDKHRVKDKGYLLRKQSHSTAEDAEIAEKTNNRVKHKTIIRSPYVASGLAPDVKDKRQNAVISNQFSGKQVIGYQCSVLASLSFIVFDSRLAF